MPRADSKHSPAASQFYSQFSNPQSQQYMPPSNSSSSPSLSSASQSPHLQQATAPSAPAPKKKHVCPTCDRAFTTSGHLARHSRVHTGERNHKCPFPGCETRCSRQDNLQQHYRIHLSPGSRRNSTRSAIARAMNTSGPGKRGSTASSSADSPSTPPSLSSPPALEPARVYNQHSPPPDSPPPLAHATLPATAHLPSSSSSRSSSSPEASYSSNGVPMSSGLNQPSQSYSYRSGTATYQEQSQGAGFTYVHTTPVSHSSANGNANSFSSYSNGHNGFSLPQINTSPILHSQHLQHDSPNPTPMSSRHSISHISHPQSYSQNQPHSAGPASPASSHSVSGPPTPSYVYHDDSHAYHHSNGMVQEQPGLSNGHLSSNGQMVHHQSYPSSMPVSRYDSPPPTLAPIQGDRFLRRDDRHSQSHSSSYLHHPQPMSNDYHYHSSLGLGHGAWKSESGLRKGVGALVQ